MTPPVGGGWRAAHLFALSGLAVTQPVLGVLGDNPTFFVAHGSGPGAVLVAALLVTFAVPATLVAVEAVVGLVRPAWVWPLHLALVGLLAGLVVAAWLDDLLGVVLDDLPLVSGPVTLVGATAAGWFLARAYARRAAFRSGLSYLALAPLAFLALFAFASPAHDLLFPESVAAADVSVAGDGPPVVVVIVDELPLASVLDEGGAAIDADRFPNLARLAADGTWYPDATAVAAYTHEAVPAILTGRRVHDDNLPPTPSGYPDTLFTLLADEYEITAHEQLTDLCTPTICERATGGQDELGFDVLLDDLAVVAGRVVLPAQVDDLLPPVDDAWAGFGQDAIDLDQEAADLAGDREALVEALGERDRVGDIREAIAEIEGGDRPRLTFVHTVFPHVPWTFHADGTPYPDPGNPGLEENAWSTEAAAALGLQRHLLQAEHADRLVGELLDRLEAVGTYDDSLVVFAADHGASFVPGTHRRIPEEESLPGLVAVPMVVKLPAGTPRLPRRDDRPAEVIDLVPTIADVVGVDIPWEVDGHSLLGPPPEPGERGISAKGETTSFEGPVDVSGDVERIWDRFGVEGGLQLYGLGPGAELVSRPVDDVAVDEDPEACWAPDDEVDGTAGWVGGHLETDLDGDVPLAVSWGGTVTGTAPTIAGDDEDHRVFVLGDPRRWDPDDVGLWRVLDDGLAEIPTC